MAQPAAVLGCNDAAAEVTSWVSCAEMAATVSTLIHVHTCRLTSITVSSFNGNPATGLCPGEDYAVEVLFGGDAARSALVTVSQGTFEESNVPRW